MADRKSFFPEVTDPIEREKIIAGFFNSFGAPSGRTPEEADVKRDTSLTQEEADAVRGGHMSKTASFYRLPAREAEMPAGTTAE